MSTIEGSPQPEVAQVKVKKSKRARETAPPPSSTSAIASEELSFSIQPPSDDSPSAPVATEATAEDEVPALSHKEKRLAKRRKLSGLDPLPTPAASSSTSTATSGVPGIVIGNTPSKSAHGIWLGNMNYGTTSKMLLSWFEERGLKDVTRINMPNGKRPGENNRGFAYLDFPTSTDVEIAVGLSEQHLDGRKLLIKSSSDFTGRPASTSVLLPPLDSSSLTTPTVAGGPNQTLNKTARKILDRQRNPAGPTLFIGNLGFETVVEDIRTMFDAHQKATAAWAPKVKEAEVMEVVEEEKEGEEEEKDEDRDEDDSEEESGSDEEKSDEEEKKIVKRVRAKPAKGPKDLSKANDAGIRKIRLGTFEDTGKCKGWAFVDFHLPEMCTRALLNVRNHMLDGRALVVEYASAEAVRRGGIGTRAAITAGGSGARGGGRGGARGGRGGGGMARGKGREWDDGDVGEAAREFVKRDYDEEASEKAPRGEFGFRPDASRGRGRGAPRGGDRGRGGERGGRAKPGAALASAQRASEAIVESTGRKITF